MHTLREDLLFAIEQSTRQCHAWCERDHLNQPQLEKIQQYFAELSSQITPETDCTSFISPPQPCPPEKIELERHYRFLRFLNLQLQKLEEQGIISSSQLFTLQQEISKRIIKEELQLKSAPDSINQPHPDELNVSGEKSEKKNLSKTNLMERLLDPQSIQALMLCGGGLLVIGLVVWLYTIGLFDNPLIVASCMGVANLAVIAGGVTIIKNTRYKLAGQGLAMLGCLVMPLNLWFYDAQGLITLNNGGHLWVPAFFCCLIYAGIAAVLVDSLFVYALVGGIALTGLLILGDQKVARFYEIIAPSTLLVIWGIICIHVEKLFPNVGKINQQNFGRAFFNAGHITLASGLTLLLGGRLIGHFYESLYGSWVWFAKPDVVVNQQVQLMAICLTLSATWTYAFSWLANHHHKRFGYTSVFTLIWSAIILLDIMAIPLTETLFLFVLALMTLAFQTLELLARKNTSEKESTATSLIQLPQGFYGDGLTFLTTILGLFHFVRATSVMQTMFAPFTFTWFHAISLAILTLSACMGTYLHRRAGRNSETRLLLQTTGLVATLTLLEALLLLGVSWNISLVTVGAALVLSLLIPEVRVQNKKVAQLQIQELPALTLLILGLATSLDFVNCQLYASEAHLILSLLATELAIVFGVMSARMKHHGYAFFAAFAAWSAVVQMLYAFDFMTYAPILSASLLGLLALIWDTVNRFSHTLNESSETADQETLLSRAGFSLITLGSVAGILLTLNRIAGGGVNWELFNLVAGQACITMFGGIMQRDNTARRSMFIIMATHIIFGILVINLLSALTTFQKFEIGFTVFGLILLIVGHLGWNNEEGDVQSETVSMNLVFGSMLATVPLLIGLLDQRLFGSIQTPWGLILIHELGVLLVSLILLGSGILCRIRATTLFGGASIVIYIASLIMLIHLPDQLKTVAVTMMVGGGAFFTTAILLSVYRERLLTLPSRIKNGEGIYQVIHWR